MTYSPVEEASSYSVEHPEDCDVDACSLLVQLAEWGAPPVDGRYLARFVDGKWQCDRIGARSRP
jgi:hypothetical protein